MTGPRLGRLRRPFRAESFWVYSTWGSRPRL